VFKHNPLPFHNNAMPASEASMAAWEQGKFWEYHDKLFQNQKALDRADLEKYAQELGLDMAKFKEAMDSHKFKPMIEADQALAATVKAQGTPNTFINGRQVTGAQPWESFQAVIDEELAKAKKMVDGGTAREKVYEEAVKNGKTFKALDDTEHAFDNTDAPILGNANAKIKLYEFSDFQ
jgi:protein-disulfide isomerase